MFKFLRNLLLTLIVVAIAGFIALMVLGNYFIDRAEGPLTRKLIAVFGPGEDDQYGYTGGLKFMPFRIVVDNLFVEADALEVGGVVWTDARVDIESVECDPLKLIRENEVVVTGASGRSFSGSLNNSTLALWLESNNENMRSLRIRYENDDRCNITGRFGLVSAAPVTVIGRWGIDDRGVATLLDREYHNPDSPVPEGMIKLLEEQISFDIRINLFDGEIPAREVSYTADGLRLVASEAK